MARTELSGKVLTYHAQDPGFNSQQWKKEKTPRSGTWHIPINLALERLRQGDHEFKTTRKRKREARKLWFLFYFIFYFSSKYLRYYGLDLKSLQRLMWQKLGCQIFFH